MNVFIFGLAFIVPALAVAVCVLFSTVRDVLKK